MTTETYPDDMNDGNIHNKGFAQSHDHDESPVGESCTQACSIHKPLRITSATIILSGIALLGFVLLAPSFIQFIPEDLIRWIGSDSNSN